MGATDHAECPKNYLRTTIAMQQHSVKRMNKELLRYSLQQPRKYFDSFKTKQNLTLSFIGGTGAPRVNGAPRTAVGGARPRLG